MAQHNISIPNAGFPATRANINNATETLATNNSGSSFPTTHHDSMFYSDTNNHVLYQRDGGNSNWSLVRSLDANKVRIVTANTTLTLRDMGKVILCNAIANITITLPTPTALLQGYTVTIKKINDTNTVTIGSNIDGATTIAIEEEHESVDIICDGSAYRRRTAFNVANTAPDYESNWIGVNSSTSTGDTLQRTLTSTGFGTEITRYIVLGRVSVSNVYYYSRVNWIDAIGSGGYGFSYAFNIENTDDLVIRYGFFSANTNFIRIRRITDTGTARNYDSYIAGDVKFLVWGR